MDRPALDTLLYREGRVRPVLRIALFFLLFALFTIFGLLPVSVLPRHPLQWGSLVVTTLAAVLAGAILLSRVDRRPVGALGFPLRRFAWRESLAGIGVGVLLISGAALLLFLTGSAHFAPDSGSAGEYLGFLAWTFLFFAVAAAFEEAIFRGYPFQVLVEWVGAWPATLLASGLFALAHAQNPNVTVLALLNIFLAGVLLSVAYLRTLSLWFATGVHVGWNWMMAGVLDFPVSGLEFETPIYTGVPTGVEWWTGGAFGPEAGAVGTLAFVAAIVILLRSRRVAPNPELWAMSPLVKQRVESEEYL